MKILYLQSTSEIGGSDITLLRTVEVLDRARFEPHVVLPREGPLVEAFQKAGCKVHFLPSMRRLASRRGFGYLLRYAAGYLPAVWRLARLIQREGIDLVHTNTIHNLYGFLATRLSRRPHVWHVREIVIQSRLLRQLEAWLVRRFSTRFIVMSDAIAEAFRGREIRYPPNLVKLYDGIDLEMFHPDVSGERIRKELGIGEKVPFIGIICRLDPWKGVGVFLDAAALIKKEVPTARFIVCGGKIGGKTDGHEHYEAVLRARAEALGLGDALFLTGWRYRHRDIPEVYGALDVSVQCPVYPEPYGLVNIEAMACGVPVVAVAEGGPTELCVQGETALLVSPNDPAATAKAVLTLLRNPERARAMGMAGRRRAERLFDRSLCVKALEAIYEEICGEERIVDKLKLLRKGVNIMDNIDRERSATNRPVSSRREVISISTVSSPEVVLLNPPAEVMREEVYDTPRYPAIGIGYIAGYLWHKTGVRPHVIDGKLGRRSVLQVIQQIASLRPKILGISAMTHIIVTAAKIAREVKAASPETTVVVGGFHASFLPERTLLEFPEFDFLVVGEGEIAFSKLVTALLAGEPYETIPGVALRKNGEIKLNGRGEIPDHLDELGIPAWDLFPEEDLNRYATLYPIMSQRGCPFPCNFCSRPYGNAVRIRSVEHVIDEIARNISEFGANEVSFYDETFTVNKDYVSQLCDAMIARGIHRQVKWTSMVHANTINLDLLRKMREAGCHYLGFGVESGHDDIIAAMKKGITKGRILRAAQMIRESKIRWGAYFIFGHPFETRESCKATIDLAVKLNADVTSFGVMVPYPGTEIWEMAIRGQGGYKIISDRWEDFNKQIGNALELENIPRKVLERFQLEGYLKTYLYNGRFLEIFRIIFQHRRRLYYKFWQFVTLRRRVVERNYFNNRVMSRWTSP